MNERLYRSREDRMIAGVAGGLAEMWDADPSLIRIVWVLLAFLTGGIALLVYIVMAIVVPNDDEVRPSSTAAWGAPAAPDAAAAPAAPGAAGPTDRPEPSGAGADAAAGAAGSSAVPPMDRGEARRASRAARRAGRRDGSGGIVIGVVLVVIGGIFFVRQSLPSLDFNWIWPLILVGLGVVVLIAGFRRDPGPGGGPTA